MAHRLRQINNSWWPIKIQLGSSRHLCSLLQFHLARTNIWKISWQLFRKVTLNCQHKLGNVVVLNHLKLESWIKHMFEYNTNDSLEHVGSSCDHEMTEKVLQNKSDLRKTASSISTKQSFRAKKKTSHPILLIHRVAYWQFWTIEQFIKQPLCPSFQNKN